MGMSRIMSCLDGGLYFVGSLVAKGGTRRGAPEEKSPGSSAAAAVVRTANMPSGCMSLVQIREANVIGRIVMV